MYQQIVQRSIIGKIFLNKINFYSLLICAAYFSRTIFIPFLDGAILQLETRFQNHRQTVSGLVALMPLMHDKYGWKQLKPAVEYYDSFLSISAGGVEGEYDLWRHFWTNQ